MKYDTLYKRTETGAVQIWYQETNEAGDGFRTVSGQIDGKHVTSEWTICQPKNVGKKNETSAQKQAESEVASNYKKKLKQGGYYKSIEEIDDTDHRPFSPMLAEKYEDQLKGRKPVNFFDGTWGESPKLDGGRMTICKRDAARSREGEPIPTVPHIVKALEPLYAILGENTVFDGEAYNHDLKDDFEELMSIWKKKKPSSEELAKSAKFIQYHVYDCVPNGDTSIPYATRVKMLEDAIATLGDQSLIVFVGYNLVKDQASLDASYSQYQVQGYEGQMLRKLTVGYENKRTKFLIKRKEFIDAEYIIDRVVEGKGNRAGQVGAIWFVDDRGEEFKGTPNGGKDRCEMLLREKDKLPGKPATVTFFSYTKRGVPRFPVVKIIHMDGSRW